MEENSEPVRNYTKAYGTYKKSVRQTEPYNPYEIRPLSDFKELIEAMKTHKYYGELSNKYLMRKDKFYELGYDRLNGKRLCKYPYGGNEDYVILYINFFLDDEPMTIVYVVTKENKKVEYEYGTSKSYYESTKKKGDPDSFVLYYNFTPISYSKNAIDENGEPFTIDFLIKNAGLKQFKKNKNLNNENIRQSYKNYYINKYQRTEPGKVKGYDSLPRGYDSLPEIFEIPGVCLKSMFKKPNIAPLINDYKKTVEEMKYNPDYNNISFSGEYVKKAAKEWDENIGQTSNKIPADESNIGNDMKRTKISGGKNKKTTKRRKNKRRQTRKRN